jgi:hypothetical protein
VLVILRQKLVISRQDRKGGLPGSRSVESGPSGDTDDAEQGSHVLSPHFRILRIELRDYPGILPERISME